MTIKVALAGAGAFGIKHLDGIKNIDGVEVDVADQPRPGEDQGSRRRSTASSTSPPGSPTAWRLKEARRRHPLHAHADARRANPGLPEGRQARAGGDSAGRQPQGRRRGGGAAEEDRAGRHVRPHPPLQPQPPVRAQQDPGRRIQHPADGCADLLLPPHQHERRWASRAAGPTTCCGTTPPTPWTCSPTSATAPSCRPTPSRARSTRRWALPWT